MKSFVVFALLSLLFVTIYADISPCQSTTERVKAAARTANAWRAACEDAQWKGASCYNYWAQLDELTTIQMNLQSCLVGQDKAWAGYTLGVGSKPGAFLADAAATRTIDSANTTSAQNLAINLEQSSRVLVTDEASAKLASQKAQTSDQANQTRVKVGDEYAQVRQTESTSEDATRSNVNDKTVSILAVVTDEDTKVRNAVNANHTLTRSTVTATAQTDGASSRDTTTVEETTTRRFDTEESTYTRDHTSTEAVSTRRVVSNEHAATRVNVATESKHNRADVVSAGQGLRVRIGEVKANLTAERANSARADKTVIAAEQQSNRATQAQQAQSSRAMFAALQVAIQATYGQNQGTSDNMWSQINNLLLHFDLQGSCISTNPVERRDPFGDTDIFQTPASKGGRFEALRAAALDTLTVNEQSYGANRVGLARSFWNSGESYRASNDYRRAADSYRSMYVLAVLSW